MFSGEKISWIEGTPMGVTVRKVEFVAPHMHEDLIEIILCLSGTIRISYCFEEFRLQPGEFILVDKDAHYLYEGENCICATFYIDERYFEKKYPYARSLLLVCEGTKESRVPCNTYHHKYLKGMLLAVLLYISGDGERDADYRKNILHVSEKIVETLFNYFDIIFWYNPGLNIKPEALERYRKMNHYLQEHYSERITIEDLAGEFGLSKAYVSEFLSDVTLGFRRILGYIRVSNAEKLLFKTKMNMANISAACGFSDPKYYYNTFRAWYKCTPYQFRRKYLSEMGVGNREEILAFSDVRDTLGEMMEPYFTDMFIK
ncbi:MAG: AraC family transcriptional regulator [Bacillota bacterium]|nr:AraC family transcriptional regulator [Bacillota bacterium]